MKLYSPKTIEVKGKFLHFWYSNNRGHGKDNVSIIHTVESKRDIASKLVGRVRTSGFRGLVNINEKICASLGVDSKALVSVAQEMGILR